MINYNTEVRRAISDEYVNYSKIKQIYMKRIFDVSKQLDQEKDILSYSEYIELEKTLERLEHDDYRLCVILNTLDKVREICLNTSENLNIEKPISKKKNTKYIIKECSNKEISNELSKLLV